MEKFDAVVLGAGDYPSHEIPLSVLRGAERVVCCDGAAMEYIQREGKAPWKIVGDCDSLDEAFWEKYADMIVRFEEQDYNDQTKATYYLRDLGFKRIAYVGATGKREDHTLGNISLLMEYMRWGLEVVMLTDHGVFIPCHNKFNSKELNDTFFTSSNVSVFNFGATNFRSTGLKYPLYDFTALWQGTLNTVTEKFFSITADGDFLVYLAY